MDHNLEIIATLTIGFALASFFAYITQRMKLSPIPGYLLAGFIIGPYSPGFVADSIMAEQLAEIGVVLMLFGVGLHFKLEDLINVKNIAIPGAVVQTFLATVVTTLIVYLAGFPLETGIIMGLAIGVASTVVLVHVLMDNHLLNTVEGHVTIGWLVVEDLFTVIILIILPTMAELVEGDHFSLMSVSYSLLAAGIKFIVLSLFMFTWGHEIVGFILSSVARLRSHEIFTVTVLALIFLIATGSTVIFGISIALGAFIAGMVIGKTNVKHQAAANALPLKDIFAIIFFLSVGMIFNPEAIRDNFLLFLGLLGVILIVKPLSACLITLTMGYSIRIAMTAALALAQIGEFSFILAEESLKFNLIPDEAYDLLVACALVSISLNPLVFRSLDFFEFALQKIPMLNAGKRKLSKRMKDNKNKISPKAVIVGFGPVGRAVSSMLKKKDFEPVIIEQNIDTVAQQENEESILFGDASEVNILKDAQISKASYLLITIPDTAKSVEIIHAARQENPAIKIITRAQFISDKPLMDELKVQYVCGEKETLKVFTNLVNQVLENEREH